MEEGIWAVASLRGFSWARDELWPQPVLSWAEQVGTGAERAWEQYAGPADSSPQPPK